MEEVTTTSTLKKMINWPLLEDEFMFATEDTVVVRSREQIKEMDIDDDDAIRVNEGLDFEAICWGKAHELNRQTGLLERPLRTSWGHTGKVSVVASSGPYV